MNPILVLLVNTVAMLQLALGHNPPLDQHQIDVVKGYASNAVILSQYEYLRDPVPIYMRINPIDPRGIVQPTSTAPVIPEPRVFLDAPSSYSVFDQPKF